MNEYSTANPSINKDQFNNTQELSGMRESLGLPKDALVDDHFHLRKIKIESAIEKYLIVGFVSSVTALTYVIDISIQIMSENTSYLDGTPISK